MVATVQEELTFSARSSMSDRLNKEVIDLVHEQIFASLERIEKQTTETNGKVRRLYLYLTAVAAFAIGLGLVEAKSLLAFIA